MCPDPRFALGAYVQRLSELLSVGLVLAIAANPHFRPEFMVFEAGPP